MRNGGGGLLAMGYHTLITGDEASTTTTTLSADDDADDADDWLAAGGGLANVEHSDFGPGPPPPEFLLPPPPLPDFMLDEVGECIQRTLPEHFASCDMSFASIKSTSSGGGGGLLPGIFGIDSSSESGTSHLNLLIFILGGVALVFLAVCVAIYIVWRRCRSRNRLSYLRKTGSTYETTAENSEHPLIYDDLIGSRRPPQSRMSRGNTYHIGNGRLAQSDLSAAAYPYDSSTTSRSICRPEQLHLQQQQQQQHHLDNDNESRIYEELFLAEDPVYNEAHQGVMLPHLADHYQLPPASAARSDRSAAVSRSSTLNSIRRMLGLSQRPSPTEMSHPTSPSFMHYHIPAPAQFLSPGAASADSLMLMSPDYSAVYHPLVMPQSQHVQDVNHRSNVDHSTVDNTTARLSTKMAESSFSSSSCSSGSTRPPSHNNSTTSTLPVACLSSSSGSCASSTCQQYQRSGNPRQQLQHPEDDILQQHQQPIRNGYPFIQQPIRIDDRRHDLVMVDPQLGYSHFGGHVDSWSNRVPTTHLRRSIVTTNNKNMEDDDAGSHGGLGLFTSLWRKKRTKTTGRRGDRPKKMLTSSSTTIFRLESAAPYPPRFGATTTTTPLMLRHHHPALSPDGNGNSPMLPSLPLSLTAANLSSALNSGGGGGGDNNRNQRYSFNTPNASGGTGSTLINNNFVDHVRPGYGTPMMAIRGNAGRPPGSSYFHGTLSNRPPRTPQRPHVVNRNELGGCEVEDDERDRLLGGDVTIPSFCSATLGKQPRGTVGLSQGIMPNPDDILPKQAWTDFSGTDEWPDLIDEKSKKDEATSETESDLYANLDPQPPIPKERKFCDTKPPTKTEVDIEKSDEFLVGPLSPNESLSSSKPFEELPILTSNENEKSSVVVPPRPLATPTFRSTKYISLKNSSSPSKVVVGTEDSS